MEKFRNDEGKYTLLININNYTYNQQECLPVMYKAFHNKNLIIMIENTLILQNMTCD